MTHSKRAWALVGLVALLGATPAFADIGRTPGSAAVTASGTATYTVPIWTPPGAGGIKPSLAFTYAHTADNGLLGIGWGIAGLSGITRCNTTIAQDGIDSGPLLLDTDAYCLDGNRLRLESGTYGAAGSTYRTELESFARIALLTYSGGGLYFEVKRADGLIAEYGNSTASRINVIGSTAIREWPISALRDRAGNVVTFAYTFDTTNGSYRPDTIKWAGNATAGLTAPYQVTFFYETATRPDPLYGYAYGSQSVDAKVFEFKRLDRIEISNVGAIVKIYDVSYDSGGAGGRSRISQIVECSNALTTCLSPTTFSWSSSSASLQSEVNIGGGTSSFLIDIDGDGFDDAVYSSGGTWRFRKSSASGVGAEVNTGFADTNWANAQVIDWDGDGRADILVQYSGTTWWVMRSNGSGFDTPFDTGVAVGTSQWTVADLDGDGRSDLIRTNQVSGLQLYARLRSGTGFAAETLIATPVDLARNQFNSTAFVSSLNKQRSRIRRVDFDGDGREDILVMTQTRDLATDPWQRVNWLVLARGSGTAELVYLAYANVNPNAVRFGDFNGDGLTDFFGGITSSTSAMVGLSRGRWMSLSSTTVNASDLVAVDFDGDGRDDIVGASGGVFQLWRGNGTGLDAGVSTGVSYAGTSLAVGEINGDVFRDLVYQDSGTGTLRYRLHATTPPDVLLTATDGFGVAATFGYSALTDATMYTKGSGATYPVVDVQPPALAVKTLTQTDGTGTGSTFVTTFSYSGARIDLSGRGFLGFASRTAVDGSGGYNLKTIESYRQDFPYIGAQSSVEKQQSGGTRISLTSNTWAALSYGTGGTARSSPYVSQSATDTHELAGTYAGTKFATSTYSVATIDSTSGVVTNASTVTTEVATGLSASSSKTDQTVISSLMNDTTNWCLGRAQTVQQTSSHTLASGSAITRTTGVTWDGAMCRPTQTQAEPGNASLQVTVGLGYDTFGNVNSRTVTGIGMTARTTTASYGARGQFPETVTNALSQSVGQTWNYGLAVPLTSTDLNGKTTTWGYDTFGRRTSETRPDATSTLYTISTCSGCGARVRYQVQVQPRSTSGAVVRTDTAYFDQYGRPTHQQAVLANGATSNLFVRYYDARGRVSQDYVPYWAFAGDNGYWLNTYDVLNRKTNSALYTSAGALDRQASTAYDGLSTLSTDPKSNSTRQWVTAWGAPARTSDALGGNTNYQFDAFGGLKLVSDAYGNVVTTVTYNLRGMRTGMADMNAGTWSFTPNALGEVVSQTDAKSQTTSFAYDLLGRLTSRTEAEGMSTWTWGTSAASNNVGQLQSVSGPGYSESLGYDSVARLATRSITSDATYQYDFAYNDIGQLHTITYPTSTAGVRFKTKYGYAYGYQASVRDFTGDVDSTVFWSQSSVDPRSNPIDESFANGLRVITGFNPLTGLIDYRQSGTGGSTTNVQNLSYQWDAAGNFTKRQDVLNPKTELFFYDALNRLDYSTLNGTTNLDVTLDLIGNITYKSDVGSYTYDATRKHAVTAAGSYSFTYDANGNVATRNGSTLTWSSYNMPVTINGSGQSASFSYAPDRSRWRQISTYSTGSETTIYVGGLLEKLTTSVRTHWRHLIPTPSANVYYVRRSDGTTDTVYAVQDHLGSTDVLMAGSGTFRESFTAYGARRGSGWSGSPTSTEWQGFADNSRRGFTGHEMLDNVGVIHMNGRAFDPVVGRFLSSDPIADGLGGAGGGFNRYAYVRNAGLSLTDPDGYAANDGRKVVQQQNPTQGPSNGAPKDLWSMAKFGASSSCSGNCSGFVGNGKTAAMNTVGGTFQSFTDRQQNTYSNGTVTTSYVTTTEYVPGGSTSSFLGLYSLYAGGNGAGGRDRTTFGPRVGNAAPGNGAGGNAPPATPCPGAGRIVATPKVPFNPQLPIAKFVNAPPAGSMQVTAPDGTKFNAPSYADFAGAFAYGRSIRGMTPGFDAFAIQVAVGHGGMYDFQRDGQTFIRPYTYASNYAVGIVLNGAGYSLSSTLTIAGGFAGLMSSNAGDPAQVSGWTNGWTAAESGSCDRTD